MKGSISEPFFDHRYYGSPEIANVMSITGTRGTASHPDSYRGLRPCASQMPTCVEVQSQTET